ncbi:50S ribosome-binding GTPase [Streptomyces sp. 2333.5]|nr:50S ribosome-binding GTPase [Streptomyces sp. 2333.5]SEC90752.1 50S ribosome-binding GTPase [Streptomyces sp. 2314.4]SED76147.1 50S ribosome-binding GTPase [Streptomyces sp. 2112.2]
MKVSEVTGSGEGSGDGRESGEGAGGRKAAGDVGGRSAEGAASVGRGGSVESVEPEGCTEPVEPAEVVGAGAGGVWDDGLIARRARDVGVSRPGGRDGVSGARVESAVAAGVASSAGDRADGTRVRAGAAARDGEAGSGEVFTASRAEARTEGLVRPRRSRGGETMAEGSGYRWAEDGGRRAARGGLRGRLDALRELIALSRTRLDGRALESAGRVLETADERFRLSGEHTVVALAGATGSGKSSLFNALAGANRSQVGPRRPTTAEPVACVWPGSRPGAEGLLHRLGVPTHRRHAPADGNSELRGLILIDLPDHDSSATEHRAQVDRMLELVDAVIWVVDPEKYADAVLHERYLRPLAGYAEVMFVVLNQVDRLPGDAADQVVDDLRRLLDEDGLALGEHGEPGAAVLALSAATGKGVGELREALGQFVAERGAVDRRVAADVDAAAERLRSVYVAQCPVGLTEQARAEFDDRLAEAVGAVATGRAAERDWLRHAERACGTPWARLRGRRAGRGSRWENPGSGVGTTGVGASRGATAGVGASRRGRPGAEKAVQGQICAGRGEAGRPGTESGPTGTGRAGSGRTSTGRSGVRQGLLGEPGASGHLRAGGSSAGGAEPAVDGRAAARPVVEHAVRAVAGEAAHGLPAPWAQAVREAAERGAYGLPEALDKAAAAAEESLRGGPAVKPRWWTVAASLQGLLLVLQVVGVLWLLGVVTGLGDGTDWISGLSPAVLGLLGGPALTWLCRAVARGPARRYGQDAERRLRGAAAGCGRARVLEPVAAELLRYREVREQYAVASGV